MLLSSSPRGSFSVPVHISLHNVRRRRTREFLQSPSMVQMSQGKRGEERAKAQAPVSSVGEERALILGFTMIAFSILMYFMVGIVVVKPFLYSEWGEATNCSLVHVEYLNESDDCKAATSNPCLLVNVLVNVSSKGRRLRLRYDELAVDLSPECFYSPKNHHNKSHLNEEAQRIKEALWSLQGQDVKCHLSFDKHPYDAILKKRYTLRLALHCLVWPSVMLFGGGLLVGLVMLTQFLAHICTEISREEAEGGQTGVSQGRLYRLLHCSPTSSVSTS